MQKSLEADADSWFQLTPIQSCLLDLRPTPPLSKGGKKSKLTIHNRRLNHQRKAA